MLKSFSKIKKAISAAQMTYNAALPVSIKVISKLQDDNYMLEVGANMIESKSYKPLEIGAMYWAQMGKSSLGHITLNHLSLQPSILHHANAITYTMQDLERLGENEDVFLGFRDFVLYELSKAEDKKTFIFFSNMLLALSEGIMHFLITHNGKNAILQMQNSAKGIQFSAIVSNLGIINGELLDSTLNVKVMFEGTKIALESSPLDNINNLHITLDSNLAPLFNFRSNLLDVRG